MKLKRYIVTLILAALLLAIPAAALASDVSGAAYRGTILVSNNGTAITGGVGTFTLDTADMIDLGYINTGVNNTAMVDTGGNDLIFTPSVNSSYPWAVSVPSIAQNSINTNYLYAKDASGGLVGMVTQGLTVADNATLEPGDNFNYTFSNLTLIPNKTLIDKPGGLYLATDSSSNITGALYSTSNVTQTTRVLDLNLYSGSNTRGGQYLTNVTGTIVKVQFYLYKVGSPTGTGYARIRDASTDAILATMGSKDVSTISTAPTITWYEFSDTNPSLSADNIRITFEYTGGNASNYVAMSNSNSDLTAGQLTQYNGSYTDTAGKDITYKYDILIPSVSVTSTYTDGLHDVSLYQLIGDALIEYNGSADDSLTSNGANHRGQAFTTTLGGKVDYLEIWGEKVGTPTADTTIYFWNTAAGVPTGSAIYSQTFDGTAWTGAAAWQTITITGDLYLAAGTQYAYSINAATGDAGNTLKQYYDNTGPAYGGGTVVYSNDGGSSWNTLAGDMDFRVYCVNQNLTLAIDGVDEDTAASAPTVPDNANDWTFAAGVPVEQIDIAVSGTPVFSIAYQYAESPWIDTVSGIEVTPSFYTSSTDGLTVTFDSFQPVEQAVAPGYSLADQVDQISYNSTMSGGFSANLTYGPDDFPLSGVIEAIATAGETPTQLPIVIIATVVTLAASLTISGFMKQYGSGGIFPKFFVIVAFMGIFTALGWFDFWMVAVFAVEGVAIMFMSKQIGWG